MGNDVPLASANNGKMIYTTNSEVFGTNLKALIANKYDNLEKIEVYYKEYGTLDIYPNKIQHSSNGQYIAFTDSTDYVIYKA